MNTAEIVIIVCFAISGGVHLAKHKEDKEQTYNFWGYLFHSAFWLAILYWAGLFH